MVSFVFIQLFVKEFSGLVKKSQSESFIFIVLRKYSIQKNTMQKAIKEKQSKNGASSCVQFC